MGIATTIFCAGMNSVNCEFLYKTSCSFLRETTRVWLLQLYWLNLTGSEEINGPKQFGALTSHTLVKKYGYFEQPYW